MTSAERWLLLLSGWLLYCCVSDAVWAGKTGHCAEIVNFKKMSAELIRAMAFAIRIVAIAVLVWAIRWW